MAATVVIINLLLSGDKGVVIALMVRSLPRRMRNRAIVTAAVCDVTIRVFATLFAAQLLNVWFLRLAGGIMILWISVQTD